MSKLAILVNRYTKSSKSRVFKCYDQIEASKKWAEYSIDELKIKSLMQNVDFTQKFEAEKALSIVRRKVDYMYRHPNFQLSEATSMYKKLKKVVNF